MIRSPVKISEGGRIVIPIEFRKAMGLDVGDELILHMEHDKMLLLTKKQAIQYVQEKMNDYVINGRVLSEELIAERREESENE